MRWALLALLWLGAGRAAQATAADIDVLSYQVDLRIDLAAREIRGTEKIRLRAVAGPLSTVVFPRNGIEVLAARAGAGAGGGVPTGHQATGERIEIELWRPVARGRTVTIELDYVARAPRGLRFRPDHAYTAFFTCHWMVCREEPGDKATLTLAITAPAGMTMVASGVPGPARPGPEGTLRQVWREGRPYSPYLFGFAVGRFSRAAIAHGATTLEHLGVDVEAPALARLLDGTGAMLDFFASKAGLPFPHATYRQVVVEGEEAQEATSYALLGRKYLDERLRTPEEDWVIAHELAHQYWGNLVTCADWSHFWLNEGLTVFMVAAWKERRWGRAAYDRELALARQRHQTAVAAGFDVPLTFAGAYPSLRVKRAVVYSKGALFVAALREAMGEGPFWAALRTYTRRFAGKTVTSADFQQVFAAASARDLTPLFAAWVDSPTRP